ncbi:MAG: hypothetical protein KDE46_16820, partial [Caldilineaceae bacterium]|nr:hypothetical protein [Caldilineaceae bacterium]
SALVDFVQWGTGVDLGGARIVKKKSIWPETSPSQYDFAPPAAAGESLALVSSNKGTAAVDFRNGSPSQGRSNTSGSAAKMEVFLPLIER